MARSDRVRARPPARRPRRPEDAPINRELGIELVEQGRTRAVLSMRMRPEFTQEQGVVHGGLIATLADTACVWALMPGLVEGFGMTSIEFKLNFLAPADPSGVPLRARATIVRRGARIAVCRADVSQARTAIATGLFTYMFLAPRPA